MARINVRLLTEDVVHYLKRRTARSNRSLEGEVRHILEWTMRSDMAAKRSAFHVEAAAFRSELAGRQHTPAELLIGDDRDFGH